MQLQCYLIGCCRNVRGGAAAEGRPLPQQAEIGPACKAAGASGRECVWRIVHGRERLARDGHRTFALRSTDATFTQPDHDQLRPGAGGRYPPRRCARCAVDVGAERAVGCSCRQGSRPSELAQLAAHVSPPAVGPQGAAGRRFTRPGTVTTSVRPRAPQESREITAFWGVRERRRDLPGRGQVPPPESGPALALNARPFCRYSYMCQCAFCRGVECCATFSRCLAAGVSVRCSWRARPRRPS